MQHTHTNTHTLTLTLSTEHAYTIESHLDKKRFALNNRKCTKEVNLIKRDKGSKSERISIERSMFRYVSENALMTVIVSELNSATRCQANKSKEIEITKQKTRIPIFIAFRNHFEIELF